MDELDMSRPGSELFPEAAVAQKYNSYTDVNVDHVVGDPLDMGVKQELEVAGQAQMSPKELNFEALRGEVAKMKEEREYWKGQAEAFSKQPQAPQKDDPTSTWDESDWGEAGNVRKAFEMVKEENQRLRDEFKDQLSAVQAKSQYSDWNNMVTKHVPELTSKNPIFAEMIKNASNPYEAAYLLAELNAKTQQQQTLPSDNAQRAIANAQKPQSINTIGGNGTLSSADYYASMSDEDFMKIAGRNLANI
jgi:hypothetical protein